MSVGRRDRMERIKELWSRMLDSADHNIIKAKQWNQLRAQYMLDFGISEHKIGEYCTILNTLGAWKWNEHIALESNTIEDTLEYGDVIINNEFQFPSEVL